MILDINLEGATDVRIERWGINSNRYTVEIASNGGKLRMDLTGDYLDLLAEQINQARKKMTALAPGRPE